MRNLVKLKGNSNEKIPCSFERAVEMTALLVLSKAFSNEQRIFLLLQVLSWINNT